MTHVSKLLCVYLWLTDEFHRNRAKLLPEKAIQLSIRSSNSMVGWEVFIAIVLNNQYLICLNPIDETFSSHIFYKLFFKIFFQLKMGR